MLLEVTAKVVINKNKKHFFINVPCLIKILITH